MTTKLLLVLTGKTASGKDTVMAKILTRSPNFKRIVTTTSRQPRNDETNGVDYNFISETQFRQKIKKGDFIEYVEYGGNLYGTEKSQLQGQNLIWRIDPSRAGKIRETILDRPVLVIYLAVEDEVVLQRLKSRGLTKEEIDKRMQEDAQFFKAYQKNYDYIVENTPGQLEATVDKIAGILQDTLGVDLG